MSSYLNNMEFLKSRASDIYETVMNEMPIYPAELEKAEDNEGAKISYRGYRCYLNSIFDRNDEYFNLLSKVDSKLDVLVLIGLGDGSIIDYIKSEGYRLKHLIIIEPFLNIFKDYLTYSSIMEQFMGLSNVSFIVNKNPEKASEMVLELVNETDLSFDIITQLSYHHLNEDYYNKITEMVGVGFRTRLSQLVTLYGMRNKWLLNSIYNIGQISIRQEAFESKFKNKPAIIISAGPSLNKHLPLLEDLKEKAVLIAAGSAIKILSANGIKPHFRMAIDADGDEDLYDEHFYQESSDIPLLFANQLNLGILPKYRGSKIFMTIPTDLIGRSLARKTKKNANIITSGASVVHSTLSFLAQAGCDPIVFIGQDMCFYDNDLYAKGRTVGNISNFNPRMIIKQKDIYGNEVYTLRNYLQIKYDYDSMVKNYTNHLINATEGGLGILNVENMPLKEVIDKYMTEPLDVDIMDLIENAESDHKFSQDEILEFIKNTYLECKIIIKLLTERRVGVLKLSEMSDKKEKMSKLIKELEYLDISYENQLSEIAYYNEVIRASIGAQVKSAKKMMREVSDKNSIEYIVNGINYLHSLITEVEIYAELTMDWIKEAYSDKITELKEGDSENAE